MADAESVSSGGGEATNESNREADDCQDTQSTKKPKSDKIVVMFKNVGNAPIMKKKKYIVDPDRDIASMSSFVRKNLHLDESNSLFLYVNQSFAPSPDQTLRNLFNCFETDGTLILNYCLTQAWG